jgi:hypothetical protein
MDRNRKDKKKGFMIVMCYFIRSYAPSPPLMSPSQSQGRDFFFMSQLRNGAAGFCRCAILLSFCSPRGRICNNSRTCYNAKISMVYPELSDA